MLRADGPPAAAGVVLCDGVGSYEKSGAVAEEVATFAAGQLTANGVGGFWELERQLAELRPRESDGATTLIAVAAARTGLVGHVLVGNGTLLEIEAREPSSTQTALSWVELALPQISWELGRPALRSFLPAPSGELEVSIGLRTGASSRARMYLACSDGIASDEERAQAHAPDDTFWKEVPIQLVRVLDAISEQWLALVDPQAQGTERLLASALEATLADLLDKGQLDDDASLAAVLMLPPATAEAGDEP